MAPLSLKRGGGANSFTLTRVVDGPTTINMKINQIDSSIVPQKIIMNYVEDNVGLRIDSSD